MGQARAPIEKYMILLEMLTFLNKKIKGNSVAEELETQRAGRVPPCRVMLPRFW